MLLGIGGTVEEKGGKVEARGGGGRTEGA